MVSLALTAGMLSLLSGGSGCDTAVTASGSVNERTVQIGGQPFGVKFYSQGVMITKIRENSASEKCGLRVNDIIVMIDGKEIDGNKAVRDSIENSGGGTIKLTVNRDYEIDEFELVPENINGRYTAGMWIKDSCAGIGTVTYYDTENNCFGCLGHGICDKGASTLLPMHEGDICPVIIDGVDKGKSGSPGGLSGRFRDREIGKAYKNSKYGLFCDSFRSVSYKSYKTASKDKVKTGQAYIYSTVRGETPKMYSVNISPANKLIFDRDRDMIVEVTDSRLLDETGGIVQGMSGSPIVQNGKLVGAVTHVFVNDPTKGYGIYIERMLNEQNRQNR